MDNCSLKTCSKCHKEKSLSEFYFRKDSNKYRNECKECCSEKMSLYRDNNYQELNNKKREYYWKTKDKNLKKRQNYYKKNKNRIANKQKLDRQNNPEKYKLRNKKYRDSHKAEISKSKSVWFQKNKKIVSKKATLKRKNNIQIKLAHQLRSKFYKSVKREYKNKSVLNLIGCSIDFLKQYLESKFKEGMSWDNYGYYGWHIDHILPCVSFDLTDPKQQEQCFHYTNLQPLWWYDNLSKNKYVI